MNRSLFSIPNIVLSGLFAISFLSSCSVSTYIPNVANTPLINEAHEINAAGFIGTNHVELQTAVSFPKNIALIQNAYWETVRFGDAFAANTPWKQFYEIAWAITITQTQN